MSVLRPSLQRLFDVVDSLVDERVGIIHDVEELPREAGAPPLFYYYAKACNTGAFCPQSNFGDTGGASIERGSAMAKAIGEAVERYCAAIYQREELPLTSHREAPFRSIPPSEFALYSDRQYAQAKFPFVPFKDDTPLRWTPATDLLTGETWYVPAAMVFVPYVYDETQGERPIQQPISTGLACHCSFEEAAISGLCEVIERDAFLITWQASLTPQHIRVDTLTTVNRDLVERFERTGNHITLFNITTDVGVPTILAVSCNQAPESPAFVCAASTHLDPEQAIRKSLEEVAHTRVLAQGLKRHLPAPSSSNNYRAIMDQDGHIRFYGEQTNLRLTEFLFASAARMDWRQIPSLATASPEEDLTRLLHRIAAVGHRALISNLTTSDVASLGLSVVRAIIPGFHPLFLGHRLRALGGSRLWELPQKLGYPGISRDSGDNNAPHPYP